MYIVMSYHQFQIFEKIGTEKLQIDINKELSERINLVIKQNTNFSVIHRIIINLHEHLTCTAMVCPIAYEGYYYMQFLILS